MEFSNVVDKIYKSDLPSLDNLRDKLIAYFVENATSDKFEELDMLPDVLVFLIINGVDIEPLRSIATQYLEFHSRRELSITIPLKNLLMVELLFKSLPGCKERIKETFSSMRALYAKTNIQIPQGHMIKYFAQAIIYFSHNASLLGYIISPFELIPEDEIDFEQYIYSTFYSDYNHSTFPTHLTYECSQLALLGLHSAMELYLLDFIEKVRTYSLKHGYNVRNAFESEFRDRLENQMIKHTSVQRSNVLEISDYIINSKDLDLDDKVWQVLFNSQPEELATVLRIIVSIATRKIEYSNRDSNYLVRHTMAVINSLVSTFSIFYLLDRHYIEHYKACRDILIYPQIYKYDFEDEDHIFNPLIDYFENIFEAIKSIDSKAMNIIPLACISISYADKESIKTLKKVLEELKEKSVSDYFALILLNNFSFEENVLNVKNLIKDIAEPYLMGNEYIAKTLAYNFTNCLPLIILSPENLNLIFSSLAQIAEDSKFFADYLIECLFAYAINNSNKVESRTILNTLEKDEEELITRISGHIEGLQLDR